MSETHSTDGGPAFPRLKKFYKSENAGQRSAYLHYLVENDEGMSLRDYFAAQALQAICVLDRVSGEAKDGDYYAAVADYAYNVADAMLARRSSRP